jgi:hypothetical protein
LRHRSSALETKSRKLKQQLGPQPLEHLPIHPRVELAADREALDEKGSAIIGTPGGQPAFTDADVAQLKAALAAEPPEAVTP